MKNILAIGILFLSSMALGEGLIGTTKSVALSNFCKTYRCTLDKTSTERASGPNLHEIKTYSYATNFKGVRISVDRDSEVVIGVRMIIVEDAIKMLNTMDKYNAIGIDFFKSFTGQGSFYVKNICIGRMFFLNRDRFNTDPLYRERVMAKRESFVSEDNYDFPPYRIQCLAIFKNKGPIYNKETLVVVVTPN